VSASLKSLVDRGAQITAQMGELSKELKDIEEKLREIAKAKSDQHVPLTDDAREGRVYHARGSDLVVPIIFTADRLVGSFKRDSKEHLRIKAALPDVHFATFYKSWDGFENVFDDGLKFRHHAAGLLGPEAPAFIAAARALDKVGLPKSDIKIEWKMAAAAAKLEELAAT